MRAPGEHERIVLVVLEHAFAQVGFFAFLLVRDEK